MSKFLKELLQANGIKGIDTQKIYSVFKQPQKQGVVEGSGGNWYIRVNGKILNDTKFKPVIFSSEDEARSHASMFADKEHIPLSQMKLTKSWMDAPEQGVAEGVESLDYQGNCTEDEVVDEIFGDVNNFARMVEEHGDEITIGKLIVKYDPETDIHSFFLNTKVCRKN